MTRRETALDALNVHSFTPAQAGKPRVITLAIDEIAKMLAAAEDHGYRLGVADSDLSDVRHTELVGRRELGHARRARLYEAKILAGAKA